MYYHQRVVQVYTFPGITNYQYRLSYMQMQRQIHFRHIFQSSRSLPPFTHAHHLLLHQILCVDPSSINVITHIVRCLQSSYRCSVPFGSCNMSHIHTVFFFLKSQQMSHCCSLHFQFGLKRTFIHQLSFFCFATLLHSGPGNRWTPPMWSISNTQTIIHCWPTNVFDCSNTMIPVFGMMACTCTVQINSTFPFDRHHDWIGGY